MPTNSIHGVPTRMSAASWCLRFVALSFPLGALGSFFSGSTTVSNLTFTQVQKAGFQGPGWCLAELATGFRPEL